MPLFFPNLRLHQVFGANTDVGKTLLTTALVRSTASRYACAAKSNQGKRVFYLKPVSTGPDEESDDSYVLRHTSPYADHISTHNLFQYREPMSPHLAAQLAPDLPFPKDNDALIRAIESHVLHSHISLHGSTGAMYVETAGGVHSPALHPPHTQSTFLRPLRLPALLIASPHLGGISSTLTSYESLLLRGYSVSAVFCLEQPYYRNHEFLGEYFRERGIGFWTVTAPPEKHGTVEEDGMRLGEWYSRMEGGQGGVGDAEERLEKEHEERVKKLNGMAERTLQSAWWPFTQHGLVNQKEDVMVIDSAHGDHFDAYFSDPSSSTASTSVSKDTNMLNSYFDGSASWFTQSHGHANESLTLAAAEAAGRYGHVLFPSGTHEPALNLAEKLLATVGQGWASRVFYSDNGSTGIEVALKMALRAAGRRYGWDGEVGGDVGIIGLRGGYHGDTIGSMDAAEASTFNKAVDWYKGRGHWFSPPTIQYINGIPTITTTEPDQWPALPRSLESDSTSSDTSWSVRFPTLQAIYDTRSRLSSPLAEYYRSYIRSTLQRLTQDEGKRFGALVMEPVCLGAGGMVFVDPLFQACIIGVVRTSSDLLGVTPSPDSASYDSQRAALRSRPADHWEGLPVVYDEVFSGLHRFGYSSAATILTTTPDISVYAKILTGGLLPLSATLASKSIFDAFLSDRKVDALLHGHSYTANPIGCAVALKAVEIVEEHEEKSGWMEEKAMWGVSGASPQADEREVDRGRWSFWDPEFVRDVSMVKGVKGSMAMGTVLAIELDDGEGGKSSLTGVPTQSSNASNRLLVACGLDLPDGVEEGGDQVGLSRLRAIPDPFPTAGERSLPHHEPVYEAGGDEGDGGGH